MNTGLEKSCVHLYYDYIFIPESHILGPNGLSFMKAVLIIMGYLVSQSPPLLASMALDIRSELLTYAWRSSSTMG